MKKTLGILFAVAILAGCASTPVAILAGRASIPVTIPSHTETGEPLQLPGILHKPSGDGPFPAVVMLHGCSGEEGETNEKHYSFWVDKLVGWGYVALQVDSFTPRGFDNICANTAAVSRDMRSHDAFAAKSYLSTLPFVDPNNIGVIGWSAGGNAVNRIIDAGYRDKTVSPFKGAVAFYPSCHPLINPDTPVLVLIGRKDDWCPASHAESLDRQYKNSNWEPEFSLTVYPNAYHAFDYEAPERIYLGHHLEYVPQATADAITRTRDFLAKYLNQVGGWSQEKFVVRADDMYFGTWTNESLDIQKSVNFLGGYKDYAKISDEKATAEGTEQIAKKWTDSDGNVWYHTFGTVTSGFNAGFRFQNLMKFSKSGTVREQMWAQAVGNFDDSGYPTKLDPTDTEHYTIRYRSEE